MVDGKENDKFDLEVKGLNSLVSHFVFVLGLLFWRWRCHVFGLRLPGALPRAVFLERTDRVASA